MWKSVANVVTWYTMAAYLDQVRTDRKSPDTIADVQAVIRTQDLPITKRRATNSAVTFQYGYLAACSVTKCVLGAIKKLRKELLF